MRFLSVVNEGMGLQRNILTKRLVAHWAVVRFLPCVYAGVGLQMMYSAKGLVTQWAVVFDPTVSLVVTEKVAPPRECLWTYITR